MTERDPLIRRLERNALIFCLGVGAVSLALGGGRLDVALGVLAGGSLTAVSYWAIKSGVDGFTRALGGPPSAWQSGQIPEVAPADDPRVHRAKVVRALFKVVGRYALLALMAYVMIARLRLHAVGLIVGASSIVAAAGIEAVRSLKHRVTSHNGGV